ncbi:glycine betaine/proline transport system substrate-binding protein [Melghirimyces profundicolus]|uniref:Glycine betaine/proline transport system substrate-binding protein n=1 Tax=Melghirimyces profundicolus TaxID=1242148 RepID=A0A2T6BZ35_9BACL|nr:ABC transporter substrate-binding protein [Melghirimyces profundicolus]PTX61332.1 glycine betaine/proline transport system substrate-binding protein [Melghirimyces profundicolus]
MKFLSGKWLKKGAFIFMSVLLILSLAACAAPPETKEGKDRPIVFADPGWDSIRFHNSVAQTIIERGYGYKTDVIPGSTPNTLTGLEQGDIQVLMEVWTGNIKEQWEKMLDSGNVIKVSTNFDDNRQGFYVPTYVIKGDKERGIKPMAPDLESVQDLARYKDLFKDPETPGKGRIVGSPSGWAVDKILEEKVKTYGLDKEFTYFRPGSDAALSSSLTKAYKNGDPWVGYYWEPTWIMGQYDMTLLKEPDYDKKKWEEGYGTEFPVEPVEVAVHKSLPDRAPEVNDFLKKYQTSTELTNEALAYMQKNKADADQTAQWFLKEHEEVWTPWVSEDAAKKVKEFLK